MDGAITVWRNLVKMLVILSCTDLFSSNSYLVNYSLRNKFQVSPHSSPSFAIKLEIKSSQAYPAKHPFDLNTLKVDKTIKKSSQLSLFLIKHNRPTVLCTLGNFRGYGKLQIRLLCIIHKLTRNFAQLQACFMFHMEFL